MKCDNTILVRSNLISDDSTPLLDAVVPYRILSDHYNRTAHSEHLERLSATGVSRTIGFVEARTLNNITATTRMEAFATVGRKRNFLPTDDCSSLPQTSTACRMAYLTRRKRKNCGQQQFPDEKEARKNVQRYDVSLPKRRKRCQYRFQDSPSKVLDIRLFWVCLLTVFMWTLLLFGEAETSVIERRHLSDRQSFSDFEKWLAAGSEGNEKGGGSVEKLVHDFMKESENSGGNPHNTHNYHRHHHKRRNIDRRRSAVGTGGGSSGIVVVKGDGHGRDVGADEDDVIVKTNLGRIRGFRQVVNVKVLL